MSIRHESVEIRELLRHARKESLAAPLRFLRRINRAQVASQNRLCTRDSQDGQSQTLMIPYFQISRRVEHQREGDSSSCQLLRNVLVEDFLHRQGDDYLVRDAHWDLYGPRNLSPSK